MTHARILGISLATLVATLGVAPHASAQEGPVSTDEPGQPSTRSRPDSAYVNLTSDAPRTVLARFDYLGSGLQHGGFYDAERVCMAPCSAAVPVDGVSYRIMGPGLTPSSPFSLPAGARDVDVNVRTGSFPMYALGITMTALGAAYAPTGAGLLAARDALGDTPKTRALMPTGITFLALGVVALAVGLPLWLTNRTQVDLTTQAASMTSAHRVRVGVDGISF